MEKNKHAVKTPENKINKMKKRKKSGNQIVLMMILDHIKENMINMIIIGIMKVSIQLKHLEVVIISSMIVLQKKKKDIEEKVAYMKNLYQIKNIMNKVDMMIINQIKNKMSIIDTNKLHQIKDIMNIKEMTII